MATSDRTILRVSRLLYVENGSKAQLCLGKYLIDKDLVDFNRAYALRQLLENEFEIARNEAVEEARVEWLAQLAEVKARAQDAERAYGGLEVAISKASLVIQGKG